jgi:hypothetical protein
MEKRILQNKTGGSIPPINHMEKEIYCGIKVIKAFNFGEIDLMLGEKEIIVKFSRNTYYLAIYDIINFILIKNPKPCITFALYFNQSMQTSRLKIKDELFQNLTPSTILSFIEGSENELVYNRNRSLNSYSELIGFELRYNTFTSS